MYDLQYLWYAYFNLHFVTYIEQVTKLTHEPATWSLRDFDVIE